MYNISKIPTVFTTPRTTNHIKEPFLADFHKAPNFHARDHTTIIINNQGLIPNSPETPK